MINSWLWVRVVYKVITFSLNIYVVFITKFTTLNTCVVKKKKARCCQSIKINMFKPTNNKCIIIKGECNFEFNKVLNIKTSYDAHCWLKIKLCLLWLWLLKSSKMYQAYPFIQYAQICMC